MSAGQRHLFDPDSLQVQKEINSDLDIERNRK